MVGSAHVDHSLKCMHFMHAAACQYGMRAENVDTRFKEALKILLQKQLEVKWSRDEKSPTFLC